MAWLRALEQSAAATARSPAGSCSSAPPATLTYRSLSASDSPSFFSSTAVSRATRPGSTPMAPRRADPGPAASATSACTSTSSGRVPFMVASTALPGAPRGRSARNSALGLGTSHKPSAFISNTPISLVEPNRFLCARRTR